jgi:CRP-like cAMP-binding protein
MLPSLFPVANKLLSALPRAEYLQLSSLLEPVTLLVGDVLCEAGQPVDWVYFIDDALVSLLMPVDETEIFAVGLVGREGMIGTCTVMGAPVSTTRATVLCAGRAHRAPANAFVAAFRQSEAVRTVTLQFVYTLKTQISETAACNQFHVIEARLARWLLMTRDRLSSDHFHMTHETMGNLLGVRRVGVTNAAYALKGRNLIDYSRGAIDIVDGLGLRAAACSCYRAVGGRHGVV